MGERKKVLLGWFRSGDRIAPYVRRLEEAGLEVVPNPLNRLLNEDELIAALPGVFATIASMEPYTDRVFREAKDLRVIARFGVGYDKVDVEAATRHGVIVAMAFGCNHEAVADWTLTLMTGIAGHLPRHHQRVLEGRWGYDLPRGLWRTTVGIVGLGRIGKAVARRCRGFDMRILAYDVQRDEAFAREHGVAFVPLETLLREADFVTIHAPHSPDTDALINTARLALMKPTAFLINTARGGLIDEAALYQALATRKIAGAALDVFRTEPLQPDSPLRRLENVILTPHMAGLDLGAEGTLADRCVQSILAVAQGRSPGAEYVLNPAALASTQRGPAIAA
ncbi:MAG: phosphoglycerate dehydrogenase [Candidatus Methylomirabilales bacterium]